MNKAGLLASAFLIMRIEEHEIFKEAAFGTISNPNAMPIPMPAAIPAEAGIFYEKKNDEKPNKFGIGAVPAAIIGALIGNAFGKHQTKSQPLPIMIPEAPKQKLQKGNYYDQIKHLSDNLRIIFTPISVVYVVKNGAKETPLDTIETDEMNEDMKEAWSNRDYAYYKNLLLTKMHSEIQFAEKAFAKKILEKQMGLNNSINKQASENLDLDFDDITDVELYHYAECTEAFFQKENAITEKVAQLLLDDLDDGVEYVIAEPFLDRPFDKYAGAIADAFDFISFGKKENIASLQGKYLNPSYLVNNLKIGFFPDRVVFIVDNKLVSTLPMLSMNEEGFEHFRQQDKKFFKDFFKKEVRKGFARLNHNSGKQEKIAEEQLTTENIFINNGVHPAIYFLLLTSKYGYEWVDFDSAALIQIIEKEFALTRPIGDIPINKIFSIKASNNGHVAYTSRHVFEKIIRSFNNKPIDFLTRENNDLNLEDFIFGLDAMNRVTPYDNIYDNFSPEVYDYIVKVLADKENYVWGVNVTGTPEEEQFITILNYSLLNELNKRFTALINNDKEKNDIISKNELIFNMTLQLIDATNEQLSKVPELNIGDFLRSTLSTSTIDKNTTEIIIRQVVKNVVLDQELDKKEQILMRQLTDLGLYK